ncbi:CTHA2-like protein [Mya arenaria]|uniref:CTHA2-like protein n=1 Tax=Mya arenaria TaxID=6604 RepID=A0ABY7FEV6_MYAAR|nr:thyrostimulin alpha-2 subunit-like [Mya arenaria]WAR19486.1 CTHA2-like protein [Mya arenaria]
MNELQCLVSTRHMNMLNNRYMLKSYKKPYVHSVWRKLFQDMRRYMTCPSLANRNDIFWTVNVILMIIVLLICPCSATHTWETTGCHRVGHTRQVLIPDCVVFNVTLNACRGYCESFAIPSPSRTLRANSQHLITSRAECCSIKETHDVKVLVKCVEGLREVVFKSARTCACSICRN